MNNSMTAEEMKTFRNLSIKTKVDSMEAYLVGVDGRTYNMQEVGDVIFGDENYSFTVSLIHRAYNFSGRNGGKYRNGCQFEKKHGYRVSRKDIEAFVRKYEHGCFDKNVTFETFLISRLNNVSQPISKPDRQRQTTNRQQTPVQNNNNYQDGWNEDYVQSYSSRSHGNTQVDLPLGRLAIGCIGLIILLSMLFSGQLLKHWIVALLLWSIIFIAYKSLPQPTGNGQFESSRLVMLGVGFIGAIILATMLSSGKLFQHWLIAFILFSCTVGSFMVALGFE